MFSFRHDLLEKVLPFIHKYESFILTTHDPADADGLGAELVIAVLLKHWKKEVRIINASAIPGLFKFMDSDGLIEQWNENLHGGLPERSALIMLDTSDEYTLGCMKDIVTKVKDVLVFDHHEPKPLASLTGIIESSAGSTSEMAVELATVSGIDLDKQAAQAAYTGMVYDTGFFAYAKTSLQTFRSALVTLERGANPYFVYQQLMENSSSSALLLQKRVISTLTFYAGGKVAVQVLRKEDLAETGTYFEEAESFVNIPLRAKDVLVSILVKEPPEGKVRCSLRSKGTVNVSKIAQTFGGGGHVSAAGFRSNTGVAETLLTVLEKVESELE